MDDKLASSETALLFEDMMTTFDVRRHLCLLQARFFLVIVL
jgi:hypothetical protein